MSRKKEITRKRNDVKRNKYFGEGNGRVSVVSLVGSVNAFMHESFTTFVVDLLG